MIIGPLLGASVSAVALIAQAAGVLRWRLQRPQGAAPGVYIIGFTPDAEVQRVVEFAALGGLTRFALAAPNNLYGNGAVAAAMRRAVRTTAPPWSA
ncbi:MAG: hypothetical protein U1E35_01970 [Rhodospirillales bacterium]